MKVLETAFVNLTSSALAGVAYDNRCKLLHVKFQDGSVYVYLDVPSTVYHELLNSQSQGAYFNRRIRNVFAHRDVDSLG